MRYRNEKTGDWVEFKPGAADLSMREVVTILGGTKAARAEMLTWIDKAHFTNRHGELIDMVETEAHADPLMDLKPRQWDWLLQQFGLWTRDELADPEA